MYKVFVNNSAIILSTNASYAQDYSSLKISKVNLNEIIQSLQQNPDLKIHLYHKTEEKLFKTLFKKIPVVVAGGGKVYNKNNEILFIKRNGKWDLPKGKTEKKEPIEASAIREVEEETGVQNLRITNFLKRTFHVYNSNNTYKLKLTYWFEMYTEYTGELSPQSEESITKAKWKSKSKAKKALTNTYGNIKLLFPFEYFN